jgi:cytochrome c
MLSKKSSLLCACAVVALTAIGGTARANTITDDFGVSHDYAGGDVSGTIWTGAYGGNNTSSTFNANNTNAGVLTMSDTNGHWENGQNTGHLLYLSVTGDFTATVHLTSQTSQNWASAGIGAYDPTTLTGGAVSWIGVGNQQNDHVFVRSVENGNQTDQNVNNISYYYLRLVREGNVFSVYESTDGTTYTQYGSSVTRTDLSDTLYVGLFESAYSGNPATATFDNFSIKVADVPEPSTLAMLAGGLIGLIAYAWRKRKN